jgi:hypothetical protein
MTEVIMQSTSQGPVSGVNIRNALVTFARSLVKYRVVRLLVGHAKCCAYGVAWLGRLCSLMRLFIHENARDRGTAVLALVEHIVIVPDALGVPK